ncbi:MAG: hypothetical protein WA446_10300 [Steroidobacteraceae bacterium]
MRARLTGVALQPRVDGGDQFKRRAVDVEQYAADPDGLVGTVTLDAADPEQPGPAGSFCMP